MPPDSLTRTRGAIGLRLFILGILDAAWWSQIALVKHDLHLSAAGLSVALAGAPVGLLSAVRIVPPLVARSSSATVLRWAARLAAVSVVLIGLAHGVIALAVALVAFGLCNGMIDITVNVQAVALERLHGRAIMSRLHAMWSLGTLLGALAGAAAIAFGARPLGFLVAVALAIAGLGTVLSGALLGLVADTPPVATGPREDAGQGDG
ncbi:MAG: MFS transporter, partial [Actinomycetota bacterium]|nr:MFS transporter [Actinomycetota bacterium]